MSSAERYHNVMIALSLPEHTRLDCYPVFVNTVPRALAAPSAAGSDSTQANPEPGSFSRNSDTASQLGCRLPGQSPSLRRAAIETIQPKPILSGAAPPAIMILCRISAATSKAPSHQARAAVKRLPTEPVDRRMTTGMANKFLPPPPRRLMNSRWAFALVGLIALAALLLGAARIRRWRRRGVADPATQDAPAPPGDYRARIEADLRARR